MLVLGDGVDRVDDPRKIGEEGEQEAEPELDLPCIDRILLASKPTRTQPPANQSDRWHVLTEE